MSQKVLEGKVILVTGAGQGIGEGIAKLAAAHGAKVVVNDLGGSPVGEGASSEPAQRVVDEIRAAGGEAVPSFDSVATWDCAHKIVQVALDSFGRLDGVVNNASILRDTWFWKMSEEDWTKVIDVTLSGYFYVSRAAASIFKQQGSGAYVHMSSTSGLIGNFGQVNYGAAKMGVAGLSKCIALDLAKYNVRSNAIAPFAFTRMTNTIPPNNEENRKRLEVLKTMDANRIAPFVVALLSDAAANVTGQIFAVRKNEITLFSQPRPIRSAQTSDGWTPQSCIDVVLPAFRPSMYPLDRSKDVFTWDPF